MERKRVKVGNKVQLASLNDLDARTTSAKSAFRLREELTHDLGGETQLSAMQRQIVDNVCLLGAMLQDLGAKFLRGEKADTAEFATLANSQRRLLADLGLERKARDVTPNLRDYVKGRAAA